MSIVGRTYYERGKPVEILAQWRGPSEALCDRDGVSREIVVMAPDWAKRRSGPRNVLIRRENGELVVRPFRGLRREPCR